MHAPPDWYPDPWAPGTVRYWTGQEWTGHTGPGSQPAGYWTPAPAVSWPTPPDPWTNPYLAASGQKPRRSTAAIVTLALILGLLVMVVIAELSHVLTVRHESTSAPNYTPRLDPATAVQLPPSIAGLRLDPQSANMAHHLTNDAESQLSPPGGQVTIGYYATPAGSMRVFTETIERTAAGSSPNRSDLLVQLETGFDGTVGEPVGSAPLPVWTRVATGDVDSIMGCQTVIEAEVPIRACAFVQGSTIGVVGVYHPAPADGPLIDEVRRAITRS
jgi:hypothetical protein